MHHTEIECKLLLKVGIELLHAIFLIHLEMATAKSLGIKCQGMKECKVITVLSRLTFGSWLIGFGIARAIL
jgi:hypothetical protein